MKPAATLGDMHSCPIKGHGTTPIVSGSGSLTVNGKPTACVGDTTGCGATIIEGAPVMMANGQLVAFQGSKTSHGGTIISGDSALMLDTGNASIVGGLDEVLISELTDKLFDEAMLSINAQTGESIADYPYLIVTSQGERIFGHTDTNGNIPRYSTGDKSEKLKIYFGDEALYRNDGGA